MTILFSFIPINVRRKHNNSNCLVNKIGKTNEPVHFIEKTEVGSTVGPLWNYTWSISRAIHRGISKCGL